VRVGGRLILNEAWPSKRLTGCVDLREERQHETTFFILFSKALLPFAAYLDTLLKLYCFIEQ
jgi:hypothetical protein